MKKILGSLLLFISLFGADFEVKLSKTKAYIYEPILLELTYKTANKKEIDWIKFEPKKSQDYEFVVLKKESPLFGYRFLYLLFPKRSGQVLVKYRLQLKIAPFAEIQNKILGTGYEQTNPIEGRIETKEVAPTTLRIKPASADLYGNFQLGLSVDATKKEAYEPVYVTIHLQGIGYPPNISDPLPPIKGVKVLADKPVKRTVYKEDGAHIDYTFRYAIIADHSFTIPAIKYKVFDFTTYKELQTKPFSITITPPSTKPDTTTAPKPIVPVAKEAASFFTSLLIFMAGVLTGIIATLLFAKKAKELLFIAGANREELLTHLIIHYPNRFEKEKIAIEANKKLLPIKLKLVKELLWSKS